MALISLPTIISTLVREAFLRRNDPRYWSGWVEEDGQPDRKLEVTAVSLDETGLDLSVKDGATAINLSAVPNGLKGTTVLVDGAKQPKAALVFEPKFTLTDLTRYGFDFRPVELSGKTVRMNMRYDP